MNPTAKRPACRVMIDFHTHVLPGVDDGSRSVEESLAMLSAMREQGVKQVVATPHFLANHESVDDFIECRNTACQRLTERTENLPTIHCGAEVRDYDGSSHLPDLKKLRIENSRLLLLEMPFCTWSEYAVKEVCDMAGRGSVTVVLAHIERYMAAQRPQVLYRLLDSGALIQCNASFFISRLTRRRALRMLREGMVHFIGSDSHNMADRAPNTAKAYSVMENKFGEAFVHDFISYGNGLFLQNIYTP